jgi:nitrogen fixation/metabolism regulation signal transduction histidine kinase
MADTNPTQNRRSVKNVFVRPREQFRLAIYFVAAACLGIGMFTLIQYYLMRRLVVELALAYKIEAEIVGYIQNAMFSGLLFCLILCASCIFFAIFFGVRLSHRIYGPLVPMLRHVESLQKGDYSARIKLRSGDEFQDLQTALNTLTEELQKKMAPGR